MEPLSDSFSEEDEEELPTRRDGRGAPSGGEEFLASLRARDVPAQSDAYAIQQAFETLRDTWSSPPPTPADVHMWVCERLELDPNETYSPSVIDKRFAEHVMSTALLYKLMEEVPHPDDVGGGVSMVDDKTDEGMYRKHAMGRVGEVIHHTRRFTMASSAVCCISDENMSTTLTWEEHARQLIVDDDVKDHQVVILHVLDMLSQRSRRFRKFGDSCYSQITTEEGYLTHAWQKECSIIDFIYRNIQKELNYPMWVRMTSHMNNAQMIAEHLKNSCDIDFPEIAYNHQLFSFRNGIFDIRCLVFYPYERREEWPEIAARAGERMCADGDHLEPVAPSADDVTMNYFDTDFQDGRELSGSILDIDPERFACRELEKILEDQKLEPDSIYWFFVNLGRLMFGVGELDNWQILFFLKGVAGSGKSTIAQLMKYVYPPEAVGVLSSNAEAKFGLAPVYKKKLVICPEAKRDFGISQGDLQSMVSGEEVSVAIKYKDAETVTWTASLLFCGNEIPNWKDTSGSMTRRLMMFMFNTRIASVDTGLFARMRENIDLFLIRATLSYHQAVLKYGKHGIWGDLNGTSILPAQLHGFRREMMFLVQPLMNYLQQSGDVVLCHQHPELDAKDTYMPEAVFIANFQAWCKRMGVDAVTWNEDFYRTTFQELGIVSVHDTREWENSTETGHFLFGVTLVGVNQT